MLCYREKSRRYLQLCSEIVPRKTSCLGWQITNAKTTEYHKAHICQDMTTSIQKKGTQIWSVTYEMWVFKLTALEYFNRNFNFFSQNICTGRSIDFTWCCMTWTPVRITKSGLNCDIALKNISITRELPLKKSTLSQNSNYAKQQKQFFLNITYIYTHIRWSQEYIHIFFLVFILLTARSAILLDKC